MLLCRYADPTALRKLGATRLTRFLIRHSRGASREPKAAQLLAAAEQTLTLWGANGMDFAELAQDITLEAHQALLLSEQRINAYLVGWVRKKYKRLRSKKKARVCWQGITERYPRMFAHWR